MEAEGLRISCLIMSERLQVRHNALAGDERLFPKLPLEDGGRGSRMGVKNGGGGEGQASPRTARWWEVMIHLSAVSHL